MKWGSNNTPPDGQLFLKVELFWGRNPLKAKRIFEGKWIFWKLKLFTRGNTLWICHMGCCLQRENLPPTDLFTSKRFYQHKISTFRNNCPSGGVLLDPNFVKLGRRGACSQPLSSLAHFSYGRRFSRQERTSKGERIPPRHWLTGSQYDVWFGLVTELAIS